jgi:hypothetical protein
MLFFFSGEVAVATVAPEPYIIGQAVRRAAFY